MTDWRMLDCQGLAGGMTLGGVEAGFELAGVRSLAGFGVANLEANRHLLGTRWHAAVGEEAWYPVPAVAYYAGSPPCSGFSGLNRSTTGVVRGVGSKINECMWAFAHGTRNVYGADGRRGPEVVCMESVQAAGKMGRPLMLQLRERVEYLTGQEYDLHHVFMSVGAVGGAQYRPRYFLVLARVPFGIREPAERELVTYWGALGDLQGLEQTWEPQALRYGPASSFAERLRGTPVDSHQAGNQGHSGVTNAQHDALVLHHGEWPPGTRIVESVDAHVCSSATPGGPRTVDKLRDLWPDWPMGKRTDYEQYLAHGGWPTTSWGVTRARKVHPNQVPYVITGAGGAPFWHWAEPRNLTLRECSRLMGFPDAWTWRACGDSLNRGYAWSGKQVTVDAARWIAGEARQALEGDPGPRGEEVGDREYKVDVTRPGWYKSARKKLDAAREAE